MRERFIATRDLPRNFVIRFHGSLTLEYLISHTLILMTCDAPYLDDLTQATILYDFKHQ